MAQAKSLGVALDKAIPLGDNLINNTSVTHLHSQLHLVPTCFVVGLGRGGKVSLLVELTEQGKYGGTLNPSCPIHHSGPGLCPSFPFFFLNMSSIPR